MHEVWRLLDAFLEVRQYWENLLAAAISMLPMLLGRTIIWIVGKGV